MDRTALRRLSEEPVQTVGATEARSRPRSLFSGRTDSNRSCRASCSLVPPRRVLPPADTQQVANELASQAHGSQRSELRASLGELTQFFSL